MLRVHSCYRLLAQSKEETGAESERRAGIGHIAVGMARQCYDLQLTQYDAKGWRATFYTTGTEHSPTSATGTGWERTPWHATQRATWEALKRADCAGYAQVRNRASCPPRSRRARAAAVERRISRAHRVFPMQLQIAGN
jgi:hypothetical protein